MTSWYRLRSLHKALILWYKLNHVSSDTHTTRTWQNMIHRQYELHQLSAVLWLQWLIIPLRITNLKLWVSTIRSISPLFVDYFRLRLRSLHKTLWHSDGTHLTEHNVRTPQCTIFVLQHFNISWSLSDQRFHASQCRVCSLSASHNCVFTALSVKIERGTSSVVLSRCTAVWFTIVLKISFMLLNTAQYFVPSAVFSLTRQEWRCINTPYVCMSSTGAPVCVIFSHTDYTKRTLCMCMRVFLLSVCAYACVYVCLCVLILHCFACRRMSRIDIPS